MSDKSKLGMELVSNSWPLIRRVFRENAREHIGTYAVAIFSLLLISATTAFVAWIMRDIINEIFYKQNKDLIWVVSASVFAAFLIRGIATYVQAVGLAKVGNSLAARYQTRVFRKLMSMDMGYFSSVHSGTLAAQINQNVTGIRDILNMTITSTARDLVTLIGLVAVMVLQDPFLFMMSMLIGPPLILSIGYLTRRIRTVVRQAIDLNSSLLGSMQEATQGIAVVKAYTMETALEARIDDLVARTEERSNKIARIAERTAPISEIMAGVVISAVIAYSGYRSAYEGVPPGNTFAFITALLLAYDPLRRLARMQINLERALVNAKMIYDILDLPVREPDRADAVAITGPEGSVRFESVGFSYDGTQPVLKNLTFVAEAGKTTALVGPSGSGKSTIAALLLRFYEPDAGVVTIGGQDIRGATKTSLRQSIAYVSQQPWLFEGSIRDNIRFGMPGASDLAVEEAAKLANAHDFILEQSQGYDTLVGENGALLSGGQRQRISIARAILRNAPLMILDEATSALDNESEKKVQAALEIAMKGRTTIVIAHRLSTVINADKIITLFDGHVAEEGTHASLVKKRGGIYARFYAMQSGPDRQVAETNP